jgi:hypothetical protein
VSDRPKRAMRFCVRAVLCGRLVDRWWAPPVCTARLHVYALSDARQDTRALTHAGAVTHAARHLSVTLVRRRKLARASIVQLGTLAQTNTRPHARVLKNVQADSQCKRQTRWTRRRHARDRIPARLRKTKPTRPGPSRRCAHEHTCPRDHTPRGRTIPQSHQQRQAHSCDREDTHRHVHTFTHTRTHLSSRFSTGTFTHAQQTTQRVA